MASIEYLMKRIEGKEKEITKLEKKMERILKAQESGWEDNPYYYHESDLKWTARDIEAAKDALEKYRKDLQTATEKANSRNVKAIVDFLEGWKNRMRSYYKSMIPNYIKARSEYWETEKNLQWFYLKGEERKRVKNERDSVERRFKETWGFMMAYIPYGETFEWDRFERDIKNEAERKYDNIIERTNEICGTITDATGLMIGESGELDGYVKGERGIAHVHTIGAGGYNIQCYHFRVLVHEFKGAV